MPQAVFRRCWSPQGVGSNHSKGMPQPQGRWTCQWEWGKGNKSQKTFFSMSLYTCYHQKMWPSFRVNLLISNDTDLGFLCFKWSRFRVNLPISNVTNKKNPSQVWPTAWFLVDSRCSQVDNHDKTSQVHSSSTWHTITSPYVMLSFQIQTIPRS